MSTDSDHLFPEIPEEIRAVRIGTCYNSLTRKLMPETIAIVPTLGEKVQFISGKGELKIIANSSLHSATSSSFFQLDSQVKASYGYEGIGLGGSASVGFGMSLASKSAQNNQALNCYCSYVFSGQKLRLLQGLSDEERYNLMSDGFTNSYKAIMDSDNIGDYVKNYMEFTKKFGHGCVTELYLTAGSAFRITIKYKDDAEARAKQYAGSFSVSGRYGALSGGAAVATEWAKDVSTCDSQASMEIKEVNIPQDAPTAGWCHSIMSTVMAAGFDKLSKEPNLISAPAPTPVKAPEIPEYEKQEKEIPEKKDLDSDDLTIGMKKKIMDEDNFNGEWDDYVKEQKKLYNNELEPEKIVNEVKSLPTRDRTNFTNLTPSLKTNLKLGSSGVESAWDLGGYIPFAYKITPWTELFPQLAEIKLPRSLGNFYVAKLYTFYLTRLQFSQYLYFLSDLGGKACQNDAIKYDANCFEKLCNELLDTISTLISNKNGKIDNEDFNECVQWFKQELQDRVSHSKFLSIKVYDTFFQNYDFFVNNAYGFICAFTRKGKRCYEAHGFSPLVPKPFSKLPMLERASRQYPVILHGGALTTVSFGDGNPMAVVYPFTFTYTKHKNDRMDDKNFEYYKFASAESDAIFYNGADRCFYGVGFEDIKGYDIRVCGLVPMFSELPFDMVKRFANPEG